MIVVYNSDERFAGIFATSVLSLFENNKDAEEIIVYLIEDNISDESKKKFQKIAEKYKRRIITFPMPDFEKLAGVDIMIPSYNRMATCGRLFIASLLPKEIEKVIYVDSDTIFVDSLKELWETDVSGYAAGMVDCAQNPSIRKQLGLSSDGIYFNSGLILVNLKYWREANVEYGFIEYVKSQGGYIPIPDEGILNAVFDGNILLLPLRYNVYSQIYSFTYDELLRLRGLKRFYNYEEMETARKHPVMVHFTNNSYMPIRPWVKGCTHPYAQRFLEYRGLTPWKDDPLWNDNRPFAKKICTIFFHMFPRGLTIKASYIIGTYLVPMKHHFNKWKHCRKMEKS